MLFKCRAFKQNLHTKERENLEGLQSEGKKRREKGMSAMNFSNPCREKLEEITLSDKGGGRGSMQKVAGMSEIKEQSMKHHN